MAGTGSNTATWEVTGLASGMYDVEVTWTADPVYRATDATYNVYDNTALIGTATIDQQELPTGGAVESGTPFQSLGSFSISAAR